MSFQPQTGNIKSNILSNNYKNQRTHNDSKVKMDGSAPTPTDYRISQFHDSCPRSSKNNYMNMEWTDKNSNGNVDLYHPGPSPILNDSGASYAKHGKRILGSGDGLKKPESKLNGMTSLSHQSQHLREVSQRNIRYMNGYNGFIDPRSNANSMSETSTFDRPTNNNNRTNDINPLNQWSSPAPNQSLLNLNNLTISEAHGFQLNQFYFGNQNRPSIQQLNFYRQLQVMNSMVHQPENCPPVYGADVVWRYQNEMVNRNSSKGNFHRPRMPTSNGSTECMNFRPFPNTCKGFPMKKDECYVNTKCPKNDGGDPQFVKRNSEKNNLDVQASYSEESSIKHNAKQDNGYLIYNNKIAETEIEIRNPARENVDLIEIQTFEEGKEKTNTREDAFENEKIQDCVSSPLVTDFHLASANDNKDNNDDLDTQSNDSSNYDAEDEINNGEQQLTLSENESPEEDDKDEKEVENSEPKKLSKSYWRKQRRLRLKERLLAERLLAETNPELTERSVKLRSQRVKGK